MSTHDSHSHSHSANENALSVLEAFSESSQIPFDRIVAGRVLSEAEHAISGENADAWSRRLVEAGESLNLRIRSFDCTVDEALSFVQQGTPVGVCCDGPDGGLRWLVVCEAKGFKVRIRKPHNGESWISVRKLRSMLGLSSSTESMRWILGQPALGCQAPARPHTHRSGESPLSPLARLIGLIQPEKKDIWVVLIFSLVVGVLALATPIAVEALVNTVAFGRYLQPVVVLAFMLFTFLAFAAGMRALVTYVVEIMQRRLFIRVVEDLAYRLPRVQQEEFDNHYGPERVNRFFDVVTIQKAASTLLLDGISIVLQTFIGMVVLAFYHPFLLGFDVVLLCLIAFVVFVLGRGAVKTAIKESKAKYAVAAWLEELTLHPTAFKVNAGNELALQRADNLAVNWLDMRRKHFRVVIRQVLFALALQAFAATALLGIGGWLVIQGELTLGQLVAAELIVMMIVGSFAKLGKHMESFYDMLASVDKLGALFDLSTESHDKVFHLTEGGPAAVTVRDASYKYGNEIAVKDANFEVAPGEHIALIGAAGSGKSTLIDMLCGLRSPSSGHIELDGIDTRELRPDSLREHLAVARSVEIFHGTIDENVHLNRSNIRANDVRDALQRVGLLDEILKLPEGLNTVLQTNGSPLTSSQALRLMLARAIVGRPRLLIIDGTLDGLPDRTIVELLKGLAQDSPWTLLVASGRSSVIESCDHIVSLSPTEVNQKLAGKAELAESV